MSEDCEGSIVPLVDFGLTKAAIKDFDCGDKFLNDFLKKQCARKLKNNLIRGYVAVSSDKVDGYITMQVHSLEREYWGEPSSLPRQVPVLMIDQIATDKTVQGRGIGKDLLSEAFKSAVVISEQAGLRGVSLWSHPNAVGFYKKLGMIEISTKDLGGKELALMYLDIETITDALGSPKKKVS